MTDIQIMLTILGVLVIPAIGNWIRTKVQIAEMKVSMTAQDARLSAQDTRLTAQETTLKNASDKEYARFEKILDELKEIRQMIHDKK